MAILTPPTIVQPFCSSGDKTLPPANSVSTQANQTDGYPPSQANTITSQGLPITRLETNGIFNLYSQHILYNAAGGQYTFEQEISDANNGYPIDTILWDAESKTFQRSLINNNTNNFVTNRNFLNDNINWVQSNNPTIYFNRIIDVPTNSGNSFSIGPDGGYAFYNSITINTPITFVLDISANFFPCGWGCAIFDHPFQQITLQLTDSQGESWIIPGKMQAGQYILNTDNISWFIQYVERSDYYFPPRINYNRLVQISTTLYVVPINQGFTLFDNDALNQNATYDFNLQSTPYPAGWGCAIYDNIAHPISINLQNLDGSYEQIVSNFPQGGQYIISTDGNIWFIRYEKSPSRVALNITGNAPNGYTISDSGVMEQWGVALIDFGSGTYNFPIPFPNQCLNMIKEVINGPSDAVVITSISESGFQATGPNSGNAAIWFRALGN